MTILERKMSRTTSKLIDQISKSAGETKQSTDLGFDSSRQVSPAEPGENTTGLHLKAAETRRILLSGVNRTIAKFKQSMSNKSAKGV